MRQLWDRKVRSWHFRYVRPPSRPHDEVCYPRYHGWYHCCECHAVLFSPVAVTDVYYPRSTVSSCPSSFRVTVSERATHACLSPCTERSNTVNMQMTLFQGFVQLGAGLSVGLAGLAAGFAIGIVGDAGVRGTAQQPRLFVGMVRLLSRCSMDACPKTPCRSSFSFSPRCWVSTVSLSRSS